MNWKHVHLIFLREMNDQLRDRRTLFTIAILPMLLYPLLGMLMMQIAQFHREYTVSIRVVGAENWPARSPLLDAHQQLIPLPGLEKITRLVEIEAVPWPSDDSPEARAKLEQASRAAVMADVVDAVLLIEPEFDSLLQLRAAHATQSDAPPDSTQEVGQDTEQRAGGNARLAAEISAEKATEPAQVPVSETEDGLELIANLARDNSKIAQARLSTVLDQWRANWVVSQLSAAGVNPRLVEPIMLTETDTSVSSVRRAMLWSKILPFVMLVWALTGAFYPAIDLCAGEKERGTLETLLSSPARRREIVWGKLLTISVFSIGSALLNLMSMHLTAGIIVKQLASQGSTEIASVLGPMPIHAFGWLVLLLIPMAAFFSALALAVAALARSTKEGQYYLMPLLMVTLPLVALPMLPSLQLNLGTSLVPVSGAVFLVRSLIEGRYTEAVVHLPVVVLVTAACCWLALRWAIRQFESEAVMFREADRWSVKLWMRHLWRDRGDTASPTEAVLCGLTIIIGMFFAQFVAGSTIHDFTSIATSTVIVQIAIILTPCVLMALFLTRSPRRALRIHRPQFSHVVAAVMIGVAMHPSYMALGSGISQVYEIGEETSSVLQMFQSLVLSQPLWIILLLMAALPAICEELAFRGFIFGGLLHKNGALRAIVVSALFFGFTHPVLQQSIAASLMGLMLGLIAWRTGGVLCTILVHAINNTLSLTMAWCAANHVSLPASLNWAVSTQGDAWTYRPEWIAISVFITLAMLVVLFRRNADTRQVVQAEMA
ncbi:MAG: ABC transporter permease subunit/CPBP intramembrane protease [Pirellulaceae bacterium]|jgi:sodium transport system permease protein